MNEYIKYLLEDGIVMEISMVHGNLQYDFQTGMKGHCYATDKGNGILHLEGRYNWSEDFDTNVNTYEDFIEEIYNNCDFGRGYCSIAWAELLEKHKIGDR